VKLNVAFGGEGEIQVLFLHGFPEGWFTWYQVMTSLLNTNLSMVAPDLRGYNTSDKPTSYNYSLIIEDVVSLIHLTGQPVVLVAHDWGGIIAWGIASLYPELLSGLVILNSPHPDVFVDLLQNDPVQQNRSSYILFFLHQQATQLLSLNNYQLLKNIFNSSSYFKQYQNNYLFAWNQTNEINSTLNWYRDNFYTPTNSFENFTTNFPSGLLVSVPTLVLWGLEDTAFDSQAVLKALPNYVANLTLHTFPSNGHFLQHEQPVQVANLIYQFAITHPTN